LGADLVILPPPVAFERMTYHQLWHERSHTSAAGQWMREQVKATVAGLSSFNARKVPA
jgi:DNA-binding transcriptional LysR family regulator